MKFIVRGADWNTGQNRKAVVEASDARDAERQAAEAGMLVSSVAPADARPAAPRPSIAPKREPEPAEPELAEQVEDDPPPATVSYASPAQPFDTAAPPLRELQFWANVLIGVSRVALALGAAVFLIATFLGILGAARGGGLLAVFGGLIPGLVTGLAIALAAAPVALFGHLAQAARNHVRRHWNR